MGNDSIGDYPHAPLGGSRYPKGGIVMPKSNRAVGNAFEQELCELLFNHGFWSKNLKQDNSGQPADVIAVRNGKAYLIDCKDCSSKGFDLRRIEDNQITAMQLWKECGNGQGWFAIKIPTDEIYMLPLFAVMAYKNNKSSMSFAEIYEIGKPLDKWVSRCK